MDRSLDEIVAERQVSSGWSIITKRTLLNFLQRSSNRGRRGPPPPRRGNYNSYPRDGVRKVVLLDLVNAEPILRITRSDFSSSSSLLPPFSNLGCRSYDRSIRLCESKRQKSTSIDADRLTARSP